MLYKIPTNFGAIMITDIADFILGLGKYTDFKGKYDFKFFSIGKNVYLDLSFEGKNSTKQYKIVKDVFDGMLTLL